MMKRILDFVLSLLLMILFSPPFLVVAVLIWLQMGRPIFFKQQRPGLYARPFLLYKFRTMTHETDQHGDILADHLRLTRLGKFLRKYSLDELPQFINVLKGEMSLVGPRPLLMEYLPLYTKEQAIRHTVKPGITGWAQVNGRNAVTWTQKFALDQWYVHHRSLILDAKILLLTFFKVLKKEGINQHDAIPMEKFNGNQEVR